MPVVINGTTGVSAPTIDADILRSDKSILPLSVISGNTNAVVGVHYIFSASLVLTLPASAEVGDTIKISDRSETTTSSILNNGLKIMGLLENLSMDLEGLSFTLVYTGTTHGWVII